MYDFIKILTRVGKHGVIEFYPDFEVMKSKDLMIRGHKFYAIWNEEKGLWSTDEDDALSIIDAKTREFAKEKSEFYADCNINILSIRDSSTRIIKRWHTYCEEDMYDNYRDLDDHLTFSNTEVKKSDYVSKRLPYPLEEGSMENYDKLMSVLYSDEERAKLEWAIGAVISGDSKKIQKFVVLYGSAGTGKSTALNIIQSLFEGYFEVFSSKALGSSSEQFALESFKDNPLVGIEHDGDLSHIEDNTRLNSLVSHEKMRVNTKNRPIYSNKFHTFLFMGTNRPVRITDAKSGIIRRLIDVSPTGEKLNFGEYHKLTKGIKFELGAIAKHCLDVYESDPQRYNNYIPLNMLGATNDFYNYIQDSYNFFVENEMIGLRQAWERYKVYCSDANVPYPMSQRAFKEELKNYFDEYKERITLDDGGRIRSCYIGFKKDKFEEPQQLPEKKPKSWLVFKRQTSLFDQLCADWPAQYAGEDGNPKYKWENVTTVLKNINTYLLHFVLFPPEHLNHIVIDFDIPDENGEKSFEKNFEAASEWPETYAELSKSGKGIHLHYIYAGDPTLLDSVFADHIEIKVFTGKASLRRMLTRCNNLPIATISSNLPLKKNKPKGDAMLSLAVAKDENDLRRRVEKNLRKGYHSYTKPSIDYIDKLLTDAYNSGMSYDLSDMRSRVFTFASKSTHNADYCTAKVMNMHFCSKNFEIMELPDKENPIVNDDDLVFFDVEVFSNLFIVCWKMHNNDNIVEMINPSPEDIENLMKYNLVGFNCRRYDNHILYARLMGYDNEQLYKLSQRIISGDRNAFFSNAYDVSYTDIYDFSSKKQSLKKFEVDLGIFHMELGIPWDQPVPEDKWKLVASYCANDVKATEKVFEARAEDWLARRILADVAGMSVNDTTNTLTTKIIFGNDRNPQSEFNYRFMGDMSDAVDYMIDDNGTLFNRFGDEYTRFDSKGRPVFPGYTFVYDNDRKKFVSTYRGEEVGEGGYVYANPGMYTDVALLDIASMHPSSMIAEKLFGDRYTKRFAELKEARVAVKHKDVESAGKYLNGALAKWLKDATKEVFKGLAQALKIAINSVYGLTSASFTNPFRDPRNKDNIVAKRGALFMINLKHMVEEKGFTVVHIKTDSIKIANATPDIIQFVKDYGLQYGYIFEHEATYAKICLVNDAVYIAKHSDDREINGDEAGLWTATGTQFAVPYVFKRLFSHEDLVFGDFCEVKSVSDADIYLDMNEDLPEGEHNYIFVGRVGLFCPIKPGYGGGEMLRYGVDKRKGERKYTAVAGTKGYRWMESPVVYTLDKRDAIDESYYIAQVEDAIKSMSEFGDVDWFIEGHYDQNDYPPWQLPCGREDVESCDDCKKCDCCDERDCQNRREK